MLSCAFACLFCAIVLSKYRGWIVFNAHQSQPLIPFFRNGTSGVDTRQWREYDKGWIRLEHKPYMVSLRVLRFIPSVIPNTTARIRKSLHELVGNDTVTAVTDHSQLLYHRPIEK